MTYIVAKAILSSVYKDCAGLIASNKGKLGAADRNANEDFHYRILSSFEF